MTDPEVWRSDGSAPPLPKRPDRNASLESVCSFEAYDALPCDVNTHKFVKINYLAKEEKTETGVYASETICTSACTLPEGQDIHAIVNSINRGVPVSSVAMITRVQSWIIPKAISGNDLESLAILLACDHKGIERRAARAMSALLLETDMRMHNSTQLLASLDALIPVLLKRAASTETANDLLPIVILIVLALHHQVLNHPNRNHISDTIKERLYMHRENLDKLTTLRESPLLLTLLQSTQKIIKSLQDVLNEGRVSRLQLGNWNEEVHNSKHKTRLSKDFSKMSTLEHFSLVVGILVQISRSPVTMATVEFLRTCIQSVIDHYKNNSKGEKYVYALLLVPTRAIVNVIAKWHIKDNNDSVTQQALCQILEMATCSTKIKESVRQALQEEIDILLFSDSGDVAKHVLNIISKNKGFLLHGTVMKWLRSALEPLGFTSYCNPEPRELEWQRLDGTIQGYTNASVHMFIPTSQCLLHGSFDTDKYYEHAKKHAETVKHFNTLQALNKLSSLTQHTNIQRLFAFQTIPLPLLYMTETLSDATLSSYLLSHRKGRKWITQNVIGQMCVGALNAIRFIHKEGLLHRNIIAGSFRTRAQTVVLSDFTMVKNMSNDFHEYYMRAAEGLPLPIRWSAPESLCEDEFSVASDVWMVGQMLFEIFTHGCHPYSDLYAYDLEEVMDLVLFHNVKPKLWSCIPRPVYDAILGCIHSTPHERTSLREVQKALENWLETTNNSTCHSGEFTLSDKKNMFPELSQQQQHLNNEPERGTTLKLKQLRNIGGNVKTLYYNSIKKMKVCTTEIICITERELTAPDHPMIRPEGIYIAVVEPVTLRFIQDELDIMRSQSDFHKVQHIIRFPPDKRPRDSTDQTGFTHTLLYRCFQGKSLLEVATENIFGDPEEQDNEDKYAEVIREAISFVHIMHSKGWIIRDICCSMLYRSKNKGKVFMPRLGRFLKSPGPDDRVVDTTTNTDDRRNWMPVEVLHDHQYSQSSDVYMLAMAIYEFYASATLTKDNSVVSRLQTVPFANIPPDKLLDSLYREAIPAQPISCPEWMYTLMKTCWNRDPTRRPTARGLLESIDSILSPVTDNSLDISCGNSTSGDLSCGNSTRSTYASLDASEIACANSSQRSFSPRTTYASIGPSAHCMTSNLGFSRYRYSSRQLVPSLSRVHQNVYETKSNAKCIPRRTEDGYFNVVYGSLSTLDLKTIGTTYPDPSSEYSSEHNGMSEDQCNNGYVGIADTSPESLSTGTEQTVVKDNTERCEQYSENLLDISSLEILELSMKSDQSAQSDVGNDTREESTPTGNSSGNMQGSFQNKELIIEEMHL